MRFGTVDAVVEGVTVVTVVKTVVKQFICSRSMAVQFLMGGEASNGLRAPAASPARRRRRNTATPSGEQRLHLGLPDFLPSAKGPPIGLVPRPWFRKG
jgi:hypothetical protein